MTQDPHICYLPGLQSSCKSEEPFLPPRSLLNNGLCATIIHFSTTPKNMSVFSKPDLPHTIRLPRWLVEVRTRKYLGYVHAPEPARSCHLVLSSLAHSRLQKPSCTLSKQFSAVSSRLGAWCSSVLSNSPGVKLQKKFKHTLVHMGNSPRSVALPSATGMGMLV